MTGRNKRLSVRGLCAAVAWVALMSQASAQETAASQPSATDEGDEIVVTGIRRSVERAADIKRNSNQVVDAISAEDLGKLPDQNIAEGLQRITGVQIQRSNGEGNRFQIRGSNQNLTLVNGRDVAPDADTGQPVRSINLFNYPSELFSEVLVYKSPSASQIEGAIGGTVDLRMPDPLTTSERTIFSADVGHLNLSDAVGYRGTALTSKRFFNDRVGVLFGVTYYKRDTATDSYSGGSYFLTNAVDVNADGVTDPGVALPFTMIYQRALNERKRLSINALASWQVTDTFKAYFDATYINQTAGVSRKLALFNLSAARTTTPATALTSQTESDGSVTVLAGQLRNVLVSQDGSAQNDARRIYQGAFGATWDVSERFEVSAEFGVSRSDVHNFLTINQISQSGTVVSFDLRPEVPHANVSVGGAIDDPNAYRTGTITVRDITNDPELRQGRLDFLYKVELPLLDQISTGFRATRQTFNAVTLQNRFANVFPIGVNPPISQFPQFIQTAEIDNFFGGVDGNFPRRFVYAPIDPTPAGGAELLAAYGDFRPLQAQPVSNFEITEKVRAAYLQLDFSGDLFSRPFSGNVGVRYVKTDLRADGFAAPSTGATVPVTIDRTYGDWLPSFNAKLDLTDNLVVRATASKVISRPPITLLSPGTSIGFAAGLSTATSGQPLLDPFRATQFDLGAEYYFDGGGMISGAFFYKDIKSYITTATTSGVMLPAFPGTTFFLTQPVNGPGGVNKGFELSFQNSFEIIADALRDFGLIANYTYVDSSREGSDLPIENTSKHSYNVIGYYERGAFQARLAYNWRDEQYLGFFRAADTFAAARGQLDFSVSLKLRDTITLSFEGINLLQSAQEGYAQYPERKNLYEVNDRRLFGGVRISF